jgi:hypothetical protein
MNLQILFISGLVCTFIFLSSFTKFVFAEDFPVTFAFEEQYLPSKYSQSHLSFMINNALGGSSSYVSNSESHETFKEQFISIESLDYNNKMIFEDPSQELTSLSTNSAPFILPVPFP